MVSKLKRRPLVIGLTGSFGTGKSTAAKLFQKKGAWVFDADRVAHEVYEPRNPVYSRVRKLFPELSEPLSRKEIGRIVFKNAGRRKQLEALIHPYVLKRLKREIAAHRGGVLVAEVPLLFESGFDRFCDGTVMVSASAKAVAKRLAALGFDPAMIRSRTKTQWPIRKKIRRSDYTIDNSGSLAATKKQVDEIWKAMQKR